MNSAACTMKHFAHPFSIVFIFTFYLCVEVCTVSRSRCASQHFSFRSCQKGEAQENSVFCKYTVHKSIYLLVGCWGCMLEIIPKICVIQQHRMIQLFPLFVSPFRFFFKIISYIQWTAVPFRIITHRNWNLFVFQKIFRVNWTFRGKFYHFHRKNSAENGEKNGSPIH